MHTKLQISRLADPQPLRYAARVLLDCIGLDLPIRCVEADSAEGCGLRMPDGCCIATEEQLAQVLDSLSLRRELLTGRRDKVGTFEEAAITWDISRPWIDVWAAEIAAKLSAAGRPVPRPPRKFRVFVTHDLDRTTALELTSLVHSLSYSLGLHQGPWLPLAASMSLNSLMRNVERLLDFEVAHGVGACFFMMSGPYDFGRHGSRTDIRWQVSRDMVELIQQAGMTIGLHGSFLARESNSYQQEKLRLEETIGRPVACHRNHYLRFDAVKVWSQLESAGLSYDFSVGFSRHIGFRTGSAQAHLAFDPVNNRQSQVMSIPLIYMDNVLFDADQEATFRRLCDVLKTVREVAGCVSLLFHPEWFLAEERSFPFFRDVIAALEDLGADVSGKLPAFPDDSDCRRGKLCAE